MKHSVLLVDDDASVRTSLGKLLQAEGYAVVLARDGAEAVEKYRAAEVPVDLVLLDLNMPLKNGWATLDRLIEANPRLPVLMLTGLPNQQALAEASGVSALVEKPIDVPALLRLIHELLTGPAPVGGRAFNGRVTPLNHLSAANGPVDRPWPKPPPTPYAWWGINE